MTGSFTDRLYRSYIRNVRKTNESAVIGTR